MTYNVPEGSVDLGCGGADVIDCGAEEEFVGPEVLIAAAGLLWVGDLRRR
jgi:hypothetical protein